MDTTNQLVTDPPIETPTIQNELAHRDRLAPVTLFILIISMIFTIIYVILFTSFGNARLIPIFQEQLSEALGCPVAVTTFHLTPNSLSLTASDEHNNAINLQSRFHLFPPSVDGNYSLDFPTQMNPLETPISSQGKIAGNYRTLHLIGKSDLFLGAIDYNLVLISLKPRSVQLSIKHLDYTKLMKYLQYPHNSDTFIDGNINVSGMDKRDIVAHGFINATTKHFTPSPPKADDNESFNFWELLADENGTIRPFKIDARIDAHVDELGILEQFVSYPLRTPATAHLEMQGSQHALTTKVTARIARGDVKASLKLHNLKPHTVNATLKAIDISTLFTLLALPQPISGKLDGTVESDFTNAVLSLNLQNGQTNPAVLKKYYKITQPPLRFEANFSTKITPNSTKTTGVFTSDLTSLTIDGSPTHDVMMQGLLGQLKSNILRAPPIMKSN